MTSMSCDGRLPNNDLRLQVGVLAQQNRRITKRAWLIFGVLLAVTLVTLLPPVRHAILDDQLRVKQLQRVKEFVDHCGPWAPALFTGSAAVLVGCGFPRLAFHFLGGALFAFWGGLLWSLIGTLMGYSVVFFAVRQLGLREVILRRHPGWLKLTARLKHNTVPAVILFRQIPLPGAVANIVLGLSPIRRREFFLGTCIGLIPEAVPTVLIGTGLRKEDLRLTVFYVCVAVALFVGLWVVWNAYTRRAAASQAAAEAATGEATNGAEKP